MTQKNTDRDVPAFRVGPTSPQEQIKLRSGFPLIPLVERVRKVESKTLPPGDLRFSRSYFLVPLDETELSNRLRSEVRGDIAKWITGREVTDVFVISHGWHRNFYQAYAGYDRIVSRMAILLRRNRLQIADTESAPFNPLFIFAHWHSDPGGDGFYDPAGRRKKPLFLQNINALFEPIDPANRHLTTDFEDMYELMSELASPGQDALNKKFAKQSTELYGRLQAYRIKDTLADLTPEEKVSTLWRCYNEADPTGLLNDQTEKTRDVLPFRRAFGRVVAIAVVGASSVLGPFAMLGLLGKGIVWTQKHIPWLTMWITPVENFFSTWNGWALLMALLAFYGLQWAYLKFAGQQGDDYATTPTVRKNRGIPVLNAIAWVVLIVPCALIVLAFCLVTYLLRPIFRNIFLWDERNGNVNEPPPNENEIKRTPRETIIGLARWPNQLAMRASANDSLLYRLVSSLDQQLAVAEMQRLGAISGGRLADFLNGVFRDDGLEPERAKLHLIGHSFGGMVICNAARKLILPPKEEGKPSKTIFGQHSPGIATLCTVQGAMWSAWFVGEETVQKQIKVLAAVHTRYDTATGYIYPFGFGARLASGSVGWFLGEELQRGVKVYGKNSEFASLVRPPVLNPAPTPIVAHSERYVLNLDASHIEFEGPTLSGGAHTDIYRDDLVNLLWSVVRLGRD